LTEEIEAASGSRELCPLSNGKEAEIEDLNLGTFLSSVSYSLSRILFASLVSIRFINRESVPPVIATAHNSNSTAPAIAQPMCLIPIAYLSASTHPSAHIFLQVHIPEPRKKSHSIDVGY